MALVYLISFNAAYACDEDQHVWETMADSHLVIRSSDGITHEFDVKVASTSKQRQAGFKGICPKLIQDWGILFVFSELQRASFNMRNVTQDLDIAFVSEDGQILEIKTMRRNIFLNSILTHRPKMSYRYAIEVLAGRLSSLDFEDKSWWLILDETNVQ